MSELQLFRCRKQFAAAVINPWVHLFGHESSLNRSQNIFNQKTVTVHGTWYIIISWKTYNSKYDVTLGTFGLSVRHICNDHQANIPDSKLDPRINRNVPVMHRSAAISHCYHNWGTLRNQRTALWGWTGAVPWVIAWGEVWGGNDLLPEPLGSCAGQATQIWRDNGEWYDNRYSM